MTRRFSPLTLAILAQLKRGETPADVARGVGCSVTNVCRVSRMLPPRRASSNPKGRPRSWSRQAKDEAAWMARVRSSLDEGIWIYMVGIGGNEMGSIQG